MKALRLADRWSVCDGADKQSLQLCVEQEGGGIGTSL